MRAAGRHVTPPRRILTSAGWAIEYIVSRGAKEQRRATSVVILCAELNALRPRERPAAIDARINAVA